VAVVVGIALLGEACCSWVRSDCVDLEERRAERRREQWWVRVVTGLGCVSEKRVVSGLGMGQRVGGCELCARMVAISLSS